MSRETLLQHLRAVETVLRDTDNWREQPPAAEAFNSTQPFFLDTMKPTEWLQWVLLPRMYALIESEAPLPESFAVTPYYEMALAPDFAGRLLLLSRLSALDDFFSGTAHA